MSNVHLVHPVFLLNHCVKKMQTTDFSVLRSISVPSQTRKPTVEDLFSDLCDGRRLLELLEGLVGHEQVRTHTSAHAETRRMPAVMLSFRYFDAPLKTHSSNFHHDLPDAHIGCFSQASRSLALKS